MTNTFETRRDEDTGFLMADNVNLHENTIINNESRERQLAGLKKHKENEIIKEKRGPNYVNCFDESIKELAKMSQGNELGALFFLLHFMQLNKEGLLLKNGKPATMRDIAKNLRKSERQAARIIVKLVEIGAIIKGGDNPRNTTYSINGKYVIMGNFEGGKMYSRLYQLKSRGKLKEITLEDADILFRILPHFHYREYCLCDNPYANNGDVQYLNETELAKKIGIDRTTLSKHLIRLRRAYYILVQQLGNNYYFIVNPDVMTREANPNSDTAKVIRKQIASYIRDHEKREKTM